MTSMAMPNPLFKFTTKNLKDFPDTILPISVEILLAPDVQEKKQKKQTTIAYDLWIALSTLSLDVCQQFISRLSESRRAVSCGHSLRGAEPV